MSSIERWILEVADRRENWAMSARHNEMAAMPDRKECLRKCEDDEPSLRYRYRNVATGETEMLTDATEQPAPHGTGREILPLVIADLIKRSERGIAKYGEPLKANNGRSALRDAYEELLDMCQYLRQAIEESEGK